MSATFALPKKDYEQVIVLSTPDTGALSANTDVVLAKGQLSLLDEAGTATKIRFADILSAKKYTYAAGAASVATVTLTSVSIVNNGRYEITVLAPNRKDFFLYGKEYNPLLLSRTYSVSLDATATVDELGAAFAAAINADAEAGFTAAYTSGSDELAITASSVDAGKLAVTAPAGATVSVTYTEPVGTISEVEGQAPGKSVSGKTYNRYVIKHRKVIKHNAISGLQVVKPVETVLYSHVTTNFDAALAAIIAGTITIDNSSASTVATTTAAELKKYLEITE